MLRSGVIITDGAIALAQVKIASLVSIRLDFLKSEH